MKPDRSELPVDYEVSFGAQKVGVLGERQAGWSPPGLCDVPVRLE
jgi:hypothetical protein